MADPTINYGWNVPNIGADIGTWGALLNAVFDAIDASLKGVQDTAEAALPRSGGNMTGALGADGGITVGGTTVLTALRVLQNVSADASIINSGTFDSARIPTLAASKIGNGIFDVERIPSLDASKIGSGTFANARISESNVKQHEGALAINVNQLVGTLALSQLPSIPASKVGNDVGKVIVSTSNPSGSAAAGTVWYKVAS